MAGPEHGGGAGGRVVGMEQLLHSGEERTSGWTHNCCHAVRLVFLLSHGLCVLSVSASLSHLEEASWWLLFLPLWIGDALCGVLVIAAWFASCPYIRLCLSERQPRTGGRQSILTEIMPEIFLSVLGLFFLILTFVGEYTLCVYLDSDQRGEPRGLPAAALLLGFLALLASCHGALLTHNSELYLLGGVGLLLTVILFAATRRASHGAQAAAAFPSALAALGLALASLRRLHRFARVLNREERALRLAEVVLLAAIAVDVVFLAAKVGRVRLAEAGAEGCMAGAGLCLLAALRARLCWWEALRGTLEERLLAAQVSELGASSGTREVQISSVRISTPAALS